MHKGLVRGCAGNWFDLNTQHTLAMPLDHYGTYRNSWCGSFMRPASMQQFHSDLFGSDEQTFAPAAMGAVRGSKGVGMSTQCQLSEPWCIYQEFGKLLFIN